MDQVRTLNVGNDAELNDLIAHVVRDETPAILVAADGTRAILVSAIMYEAMIARLENVEAALRAAQGDSGSAPLR